MSNTLQPIELTDSDLDAVSGGWGSYNKQVAAYTGSIVTGANTINYSSVYAGGSVLLNSGDNNTGNVKVS